MTLLARHIDSIGNIAEFFEKYEVRLNQVFPKMQLSPDCPVTPSFRAEMNKWMVEFFGFTDDIPTGYLILAEYPIVYVGMDTAKMLLQRHKDETSPDSVV